MSQVSDSIAHVNGVPVLCPSDQSAAKKTDDGYQAKDADVEFRLD